MKVQLLARPDHSVFLYEELTRIGVDASYYTFHAFREGSVWNRLVPSRKTVPASAKTATVFTMVDYPLARFGLRTRINTRPAETWLAAHLLRPPRMADVDVIHYWPFYFASYVRAVHEQRDVATLADYYEAEPSFANSLYRAAYRRAGIPFERPFNELIDQNAAFGFERDFVVPSELTADSYRRRFPDARLHIVPYGLMGKQIVGRATARPRRRWVFVGRVCIEKGIDLAIEAMAELGELSLDLIGGIPTEQERYLRDLASRAPNVRLLGHMPNVEVLRRLPDYEAFLMPSLCDSYSIASIEAICAGLPVVVTENCGVAAAVREYGLGAVCVTGSSTALVTAMRSVAEDLSESDLDDGLQRFAAAERARPYARRMLELYSELTSETRRARHAPT